MKKTEKPLEAVILTKHIALEAAAALAYARQEELSEYFFKDVVEKAKGFKEETDTDEQERIVRETADAQTYALSKGGLLAALWEMSVQTGRGMDIDLKAVPVRQETVEICEFYSLNPYELPSKGSLLIITREPLAVCKALENEGIEAAVIGSLNSSNDRILRHDDVRSFLNRPSKSDAFERLIN